jgi:predicted dehydrogenase
MISRIHRRRFLARGLAGGAAGAMLLPSVRSALGYQANERINLAVMGQMYVAGHFFSAVHAYENVGIAAVCNPDRRRIPEVWKTWQDQAEKLPASARPEDRRAGEQYRGLLENRPPLFADFRRMLDELGGQIDAVIVSMFDHYHGVACGAAMQAGKHVFCERPLGLTIRESRALGELAARQKVATSIRNPGNASGQFRRGLELVREGAIGPVEEVYVWFDRGGPDLPEPPQGEEPVPEELDWDLWLGPAAMRPYHPQWMSYAFWRAFSNGGIGTFGPHAANLALMSLRVADLWRPGAADASGASRPTIRVEAECSRINRHSFPRWEVVRWQVPARGKMPPVRFTWSNGPGFAPGWRERLEAMLGELGASAEDRQKLLGYAGALLVGGNGALVSDDHNARITLLPEQRFRDVDQSRPMSVPASRGHYHDWLFACRGGEPPWAGFDYAAPLSEFLMLGNLATQFEGPLEYDPLGGRILNHPEADRALGYEYRDGWRHP